MDDLSKVLTFAPHEDFVEYFVFPPVPPNEVNNENYLIGQLNDLNAKIQALVADYLWQKDSCVLRLSKNRCLRPTQHFGSNDATSSDCKSSAEECLPSECFYGITNYGDCVEDEWFIVYIMMLLTKNVPGLVVRVADNDGEFLLIEAAEYLPSWAESDASCNKRVYLFNGEVHLIPKPDILSAFPEGIPSLTEAVNAIRKHSKLTRASDEIQTQIFSKISEYPDKILKSFHEVNLMLPAKLAVILKRRPDVVSHGVNAFYYRDPIDLKAARLMKNFKPSENLVKTRIRLTKVLYGMLSKQDFRADPKTGWSMPPSTSHEFRSHSLGAKLTMGFEILLNRGRKVSSDMPMDLLPDTTGWNRYEQSLKKTGYFRGYLENSKPYVQLLEKAKIFYLTACKDVDSSSEEDVVIELQSLFKTSEVNMDSLLQQSQSLPPDDGNDDSWMDVDPNSLEAMLQSQFQGSSSSEITEIPAKLKAFMKTFSDFEGVEFLNGDCSGNGSTEDKGNSNVKRKKQPNRADDGKHYSDILEPLDFRADDFVSAVDKLLLDLGKPDKDWDASDDSFESDDDERFQEIKKMHDFAPDSKIHHFMAQMDKELEDTDVGKSFAGPSTSKAAAGLAGQAGDGAGSSKSKANVSEVDEFDDAEAFDPVNIDMNVLANMLESLQSQDGPCGPSANLLRSVGFDIPKIYEPKK